MRVGAVVVVEYERYEVIRSVESLPPQREKTWRKRMGEAVAEPAGLVDVGQALQTGRCRSHAVAQRRPSGHPIATPTRLEMSAL